MHIYPTRLTIIRSIKSQNFVDKRFSSTSSAVIPPLNEINLYSHALDYIREYVGLVAENGEQWRIALNVGITGLWEDIIPMISEQLGNMDSVHAFAIMIITASFSIALVPVHRILLNGLARFRATHDEALLREASQALSQLVRRMEELLTNMRNLMNSPEDIMDLPRETINRLEEQRRDFESISRAVRNISEAIGTVDRATNQEAYMQMAGNITYFEVTLRTMFYPGLEQFIIWYNQHMSNLM